MIPRACTHCRADHSRDFQNSAGSGEKEPIPERLHETHGRCQAGAVRDADFFEGNAPQVIDCFLKLRLAKKTNVRTADNGVNLFAGQL